MVIIYLCCKLVNDDDSHQGQKKVSADQVAEQFEVSRDTRSIDYHWIMNLVILICNSLIVLIEFFNRILDEIDAVVGLCSAFLYDLIKSLIVILKHFSQLFFCFLCIRNLTIFSSSIRLSLSTAAEPAAQIRKQVYERKVSERIHFSDILLRHLDFFIIQWLCFLVLDIFFIQIRIDQLQLDLVALITVNTNVRMIINCKSYIWESSARFVFLSLSIISIQWLLIQI